MSTTTSTVTTTQLIRGLAAIGITLSRSSIIKKIRDKHIMAKVVQNDPMTDKYHYEIELEEANRVLAVYKEHLANVAKQREK